MEPVVGTVIANNVALPSPIRRPGRSPRQVSSRTAVLEPFSGDATALVEGLRASDPRAKVAFFQRYAARVERIITHVLGFDAELADVVQEVFAAALASVHNLKNPSAMEPWLARVAALTARKVLRSRSRRAWLRRFIDSSEEEAYEPLGLALDFEGRRSLRAVYSVLQSLPADEQIAFALRFIDGMGLTEIATATSVSLATVKRRLARAEHRFIVLSKKYPELKPWVNRASRWQGR